MDYDIFGAIVNNKKIDQISDHCNLLRRKNLRRNLEKLKFKTSKMGIIHLVKSRGLQREKDKRIQNTQSDICHSQECSLELYVESPRALGSTGGTHIHITIPKAQT